jgi:hypothetical protein
MLSNYYKLHQNPVGVQVFSKFSELPILWFSWFFLFWFFSKYLKTSGY